MQGIGGRAWASSGVCLGLLVALGCGGGGGDDDDDSADDAGSGAGSEGSRTAGSGGSAGSSGASGGGGSGGSGGSTGPRPVEIGTFMGLTGFDHKLAAESGVVCGLDGAGEVKCEGGNTRDFENPPAGPHARLDIANEAGCVLSEQGEAKCWGDTFGGNCDGLDEAHCDLLSPPPGPYTAIAISDNNACGIRPSGQLECWGQNRAKQSEPPAGTFVDLTMDEDFGCAIATDGHIECWGSAFHSHPARIEGNYQQIALHGGNLCMLDSAGKISCDDSFVERYAEDYSVGTYKGLAVGSDWICGLLEDGSVECWNDDSIGRLPPPVGPWHELDGYYRFACAHADDGRFECWGPGFGDGAAMLECDYGASKLAGTVDGEAYAADLDTGAQYSFGEVMGYRFGYTIAESDTVGPGLMIFDGMQALGPDSVALRQLVDKGAVPVDRSILQLKASATDPGPIHCTGADSGSTISLHIDEVALDLKNVHVMGTCPGTAVDGELEVCPGEGSLCNGYTGSLEGMDVMGGFEQTSHSLGEGHASFYGSDRELLRIITDDAGSVVWAIFASAPDGPFGGAVYCAGADSSYTSTDDRITYTLRGLSKLEACSTESSSDALTGCIR